MKKLKILGIAIFFIVAFGLAGRSDKQDAILAEMKNNGAYYELSQQHPTADDVELIKLYEQTKSKK